ncbi:COBRA-like protein 7 [Andrographis paniculata]|uniref:COBRA-like protein 7 n=1 Tax=Andrographis paniculata TaxID=175694 RepID=UPI0021E819C8|nr:COBRA-like protein 7 [Andrographis paniculata]
MAKPVIILISLTLCIVLLPNVFSQTPNTNTSICNGILVTYQYTGGARIQPVLSPADQPYRFESTLTVRNNGPVELKNWQVFVGFRHGELLVTAGNAVLADGTPLPANVTGGTVFAGSPDTDLKTAIETAGDVDQMQAVVQLVGTQFGVAPPDFPLPDNLTLVNDGYLCPNPPLTGNNSTSICCTPDPTARTNTSIDGGDFSPLQNGDVSIMYDVLMSYEGNYLAQVTIENQNPLNRIQDWNLSWEWMQGEFINSIRGAYPKIVDPGDCIFGNQGQFYKQLDLSKALTCDRRPTIIDLPISMANDDNLGKIPFCCRNGTILPPSMDSGRSKSSFQMQVYKMPPYLNITHLYPPRNWNINSTLGSDYQCRQPVRVAPSLFPDAAGLPSRTAAVASWQVVCNATLAARKPKCCVSFSSFSNNSVVPCNTCACGCDRNLDNGVCSAAAPALLLPAEALLLPFDNRTELATAFARQNRRRVPSPLPCADNCGVSINWHLLSDFRGGWTARITLFNWDGNDVVDWFAAVELDKAMPGFEKVYSMDGARMSGSDNRTLFLKGLPNHNYLVAERNGSNPRKDPRVPGTQQSVISFTKKQTPGIHVAGGDGFPTKIFFNGEECSVPTTIPSTGRKNTAAYAVLVVCLISSLIYF